MNAEVYQFDIARTSDAATLHAYRDAINEDHELTPQEMATLNDAIDKRFGAMNRAALPNPKPRY
jgi:hypothetical protein